MWLYIGGGRWLHGIPARDLDADEWDALAPALQAVAVERGLYRKDDGPGAEGQANQDDEPKTASRRLSRRAE